MMFLWLSKIENGIFSSAAGLKPCEEVGLAAEAFGGELDTVCICACVCICRTGQGFDGAKSERADKNTKSYWDLKSHVQYICIDDLAGVFVLYQ